MVVLLHQSIVDHVQVLRNESESFPWISDTLVVPPGASSTWIKVEPDKKSRIPAHRFSSRISARDAPEPEKSPPLFNPNVAQEQNARDPPKLPPSPGSPPPPPPKRTGPKTRSLAWRKVPANKITASVFWSQAPVLDLGIDGKSIKTLFLISDSKSFRKDSPAQSDVVRLIDNNRARNIEIMLNTRLKAAPLDIAKAVQSMDNSAIDSEGVFVY